MAPRRNNSGPSVLDVQNLFGLDQSISFDGSADSAVDLHEPNIVRCCIPNTECLKTSDFGLINLDDLSDCVRVTCNNETCTAGNYMHRECFEAWEHTALSYLKSVGRARSWSDKQRQQNLWTKKGYDLVYKVCSCKCGRGHLKKDLDWQPPQSSPATSGVGCFDGLDAMKSHNNSNNSGGGSSGKKKKRNRNGQKVALSLGQSNANGVGGANFGNQPGKMAGLDLSSLLEASTLGGGRGRANSIGSSNGSSSPPVSSSEQSISPVHNASQGSNINNNSITKNNNIIMKQQIQQQQMLEIQRPLTPRTLTEIYSERVRATSGANGIFSRRLDFSSFNILPKTRINSYAVKIEDEGNHGNDETRLFILSSLAAQHKSRINCILCDEPMLVFDRYPLVDGTFFLSPKKHTSGSVEVKYENRAQFLNGVCMACLEGVTPDRVVRCRFCSHKWEGSSLVLGTMYSYDIFAAVPCCTERLKCNNCFKLLLHPNQRLTFYSDYSHPVSCPHCASQDTHFVKPLSYCYTKQAVQSYPQWP